MDVAMHKLTERTFANADRTAVTPEGSDDAKWFVGNEDDEIPVDLAERLGLKSVKAPAEDKAVKAPPATKAVKDR